MSCHYSSLAVTTDRESHRERQGSLKHGKNWGHYWGSFCLFALFLCAVALIFLLPCCEFRCMFRRPVPSPLQGLETIRDLCWLQGLVPLCLLNHPFIAYTSPTNIQFMWSRRLDTRSSLWATQFHSAEVKVEIWPCAQLAQPIKPSLVAGTRPGPVFRLLFSTHTQSSSLATPDRSCENRTECSHPP